jgi:hypothetical protein
MTNVPVITVHWDFVYIIRLAAMTMTLVLLIPVAHLLDVSILKEIVMITTSAPLTVVTRTLDVILKIMWIVMIVMHALMILVIVVQDVLTNLLPAMITALVPLTFVTPREDVFTPISIVMIKMIVLKILAALFMDVKTII